MNQKYSKEITATILKCYSCGVGVSDISRQYNIPRTTIYRWITESRKSQKRHDQVINLKIYREMETKYERSKKIVRVLQSSPFIQNATLDDKMQIIDKMVSDELTINTLCEAFSVSRATYYNRKLRGKNGNTQAKQKRDSITPVIKEIYDDSNQIYGPGKIHAILKDRGYTISSNVVASIMHNNHWFSIRGGAKALYEQNLARKENILKQQFTVSRPNEVWVSDVTELQFDKSKLYLCVIIDLFARKIIGYRISEKNNTPLLKKAIDSAYKSREPKGPLLFHSDQGANYTSRTIRALLASLNITQSFSRPGMPYDNSVCESFFSIFKQEEFYRVKYKTKAELLKGVNSFMTFYNSKRPHSILRYRTPDAFEEDYYRYNKGFRDDEM